MEFEINLTKEHWVQLNQYLCQKKAKESKGVFSSFWINMILWFFITTFSIMVLKNISKLHWPTAIFVLIFGALFHLYFYWGNRKIRKALMPAEDGAFSGKKVYQIDDSGLKLKAKGYIAQFQWDIIKSVETGNGLLLAFIDNSSALIFPTDQLDDGEGLVEKMKEHIA